MCKMFITGILLVFTVPEATPGKSYSFWYQQEHQQEAGTKWVWKVKDLKKTVYVTFFVAGES